LSAASSRVTCLFFSRSIESLDESIMSSIQLRRRPVVSLISVSIAVGLTISFASCSSGGQSGKAQKSNTERATYEKSILDASRALADKIGPAEVGSLTMLVSSGAVATPPSEGDAKVKKDFTPENQALGRSVCAAFEQYRTEIGTKAAFGDDAEHARFLAAESVKSSLAGGLLRAATALPGEASEKVLALLGVPGGDAGAPLYVGALKASGILDPQGAVAIPSPFSDTYSKYLQWLVTAKGFEAIVVDLALPAVLEINKCIVPPS
jgi:hypothetical protein